MVKKKMCFRCRRSIEEKDNYYSFTEYNNKRLIKIDYAHRTCWDNFLKQIGDTTEAMDIVRSLKSKLTTMGVLEPEQVVLS